MGRPKMFKTTAEAEKWALDKGAPKRGSTQPITSYTRGLARTWLSAAGVPAARALRLSVAELSAAWHDTSNATLDRLVAGDASPAQTPQENENMAYQQPMILTRPQAPQERPPQPAQVYAPPVDISHEAKLRALAELLTPTAPTLDESAVVEIMTRHMGGTIQAATAGAIDTARRDLSDILEEARAIVNGAPRTLRIDIAGRIRDLPAAARHPMFDALLTMVVAGREDGGWPVMLVGPAGSGKTTACQHVANAIGLPFYTNGALTGAHELTGYKDASGHYHGTPFRQAFEHGGVYLMDEMDRSDPAAVLTLNSALANRFAGFPDRAEPVRAHADFIPLVAANTFGRGADRLYIGANQMDAATLDRFCVLSWDYDEALERSIAGDDAWTAYVQAARNAAAKHKIRHVISPRASMAGANLRRAGMPFDLVAEAVLWKGLDQEQRSRITAEISENVSRRAMAPRITIAAE